jgi:hypothetical protein
VQAKKLLNKKGKVFSATTLRLCFEFGDLSKKELLVLPAAAEVVFFMA